MEKMEINMDKWEKWDRLQPGKRVNRFKLYNISSILSNLHISERIEVYIYIQTLVLSHICIFLDVRYNHFSPCTSCFFCLYTSFLKHR